MLAMHMADQLLSLPVALISCIMAAGALAVAARLSRRGLAGQQLPLMGVMGAFVFAAQMINFPLPFLPGTSGHLSGGVLLAILLGPWSGIVAMAGILIIQCLLFQDGGLLALGCNIINMGIVPCLLGWGVYRLVLRGSPSGPRTYLGAWLGCLVGVTAGAALVPLEAAASGVLRIPATDFLAVMVGVHLLIGTVEGLITFAVLAYLRQAYPVLLGFPASPASGPMHAGKRTVAVSLLAVALLLGGVVSWFASSHPDGLEWSYSHHQYEGAGNPLGQPGAGVAAAEDLHSRIALMPDYGQRPAPLGQTAREPATHPAGNGQPANQTAAGQATEATGVSGWKSLAGLTGTVLTLGVLYILSRALRQRGDAGASGPIN